MNTSSTPAQPIVVYISGPMTGYEDYNRPAFYAAEAMLKSRLPEGSIILNPAGIFIPVDAHPSRIWDYAMRKALVVMAEANAIFLLPGWSHSKGAMLEAQIAKAMGFSRIFESEGRLLIGTATPTETLIEVIPYDKSSR